MADLAPAAFLYAGRVAHIRHSPFRHRFDYRLWMMAVELDRIGELAAKSWLFRHNRTAVLALHDRDHGNRDGSPLRNYVEASLAQAGLGAFTRRIVFVTTPRLFGYAFNPISFYFCYDDNDILGAVLHQVKNTFGDQIGYVMPVQGAGMIRQSAPKRMHVSPFFDLAGGYRFVLTPPGEELMVSIQYGAPAQKRMTATMMLQRRPWTQHSLLRLALQMPFAPMKVMLAIHWQALKLFCRGAKFHSVPAQTHEAVIAGESQ